MSSFKWKYSLTWSDFITRILLSLLFLRNISTRLTNWGHVNIFLCMYISFTFLPSRVQVYDHTWLCHGTMYKKTGYIHNFITNKKIELTRLGLFVVVLYIVLFLSFRSVSLHSCWIHVVLFRLICSFALFACFSRWFLLWLDDIMFARKHRMLGWVCPFRNKIRFHLMLIRM